MKTVIKENEGFRLTLNKNKCKAPTSLNNIEMTGEQLKDGKVTQTSTYQFFMSDDEIATLSKALAQ